MISTLRKLCKNIAYRSGLLGGYHLIRNRRNLTVAMFHRVLPEGDVQWASADSNWTVSVSLFRECLLFFQKHYNIIGVEEIRDLQRCVARMPPRPLLITLDDGWADNAEHALQVLVEMKMPATVFVVAEAVVAGRIWDQFLYTLWRQGLLGQDEWNTLIGDLPSFAGADLDVRSTAAFRNLLATLSKLPATDRNSRIERIAHLRDKLESQRVLTAAQIQQLHKEGITIGSHGLTHALIPHTSDPEHELAMSRKLLSGLLGGVEIAALSFPHGSYDDSTVSTAVNVGYRLLFGSRPYLNHFAGSAAPGTVFGRVNICATNIAGSNGLLAPAELATLLFSRPTSVVS